MFSRVFTVLALVSAGGLVFVSYRLTGDTRCAITLRVTVPDESGITRPGGRLRFDLLQEEVTGLIDSLAELETVEPDIGRWVEDPGREAFLRGLIEQRGFWLSRAGAQALRDAGKTRDACVEQMAAHPTYADLAAAAERVGGPRIVLASAGPMRSMPPPLLALEAQRYAPRSSFFSEEDAPPPDDSVLGLHRLWVDAVNVYETRYRRELLERTLLAVTQYRERTVATVVTDTLGHAVFAPVFYGRYWLTGYYPQTSEAFARLPHRQTLKWLHPAAAQTAAVSVWNTPLVLDASTLQVSLSADHVTATLP